MARRRRRGGLLALVLVLAVLAGATTGVVAWLRSLDRAAPLPDRCAAVVDGTSWYLDPEQADNAALIAITAVRRGLPARAATIALATALQESDLRNLDHGDRDSLGLFQQRPSQGWGTPEQVSDPVYATNAFYDALVRVPDYQDLPITEAAQLVQRSAFPDAYAFHEARSRAWASALTGYSPATLTCRLGEPAPVAADAVAARVARDLGVPVTAVETGLLSVDTSTLPGAGAEPERLAWATAQCAVAAAGQLGLAEVRVGDRTWLRGSEEWATLQDATPLPPGSVELVLTVDG